MVSTLLVIMQNNETVKNSTISSTIMRLHFGHIIAMEVSKESFLRLTSI